MSRPANLTQRYTRRYFDKWYRDPAHRIITPADTRRKAALALSVAEYYLGRPIRTVLDIACGEGQWCPALKKLRPVLAYTGVDPSAYAVRRFGRRRHVLRGSFAELPPLADSYDLIICSDALYYIPEPDLDLGLRALIPRLAGIAFLEAYPNDETASGDPGLLPPRDAAFYRRLFRRHRLVSCGAHCYAGPQLAASLTSLERGR